MELEAAIEKNSGGGSADLPISQNLLPATSTGSLGWPSTPKAGDGCAITPGVSADHFRALVGKASYKRLLAENQDLLERRQEIDEQRNERRQEKLERRLEIAALQQSVLREKYSRSKLASTLRFF